MKPDCKLQIPAECKFPFVYKNLPYTTCTGVDATNTMWCSTDRTYAGQWKQCNDPCSGKWSVKAIASTVVAGSVALTGIGLMGAAIHNNQKHGEFNPFVQKPVGGEVTPGATAVVTVAPVVVTVTGAPFLIQAPVSQAPGAPAVGVMGQVISVPASTVAEGRRLRALAAIPVEIDVPVGVLVTPAVAPTTTMGPTEANQHMGLLIVGVLLVACCLGCICSVAVAHYAGFGKKRKQRVDPNANQAGYPQAYDSNE